MGTNWKEQAENARFKSDIYGLLATVFREEPSAALIRELRDPQLSGVFSELGVDLGKVFFTTPEKQLIEILGLEFTRLFIGPDSHISAHEGLDYNPEFTGVPDHVSVELEFMQKLTAWEVDKWQQHDRKNAQFCMKVQRMFLEQHLLAWLPQFCDVIMEQADIGFYSGMAELTKNYLEFEQQNIETEAAA
jgi:TorA maturation chaperone TorD